MKFRIRDTDAKNQTEYERKYALYLQHLGTFDISSNTDLWRYFYWDFFHDASIRSIRFEPTLKTITIKMATTIHPKTPKNRFDCAHASFECRFKNVVHFSIDTPKHFNWNQGNPSNASFLYSEINTSPKLRHLKPKGSYYSLLIEAIANSTIWIDIVFSQINVSAKEPLVFYQMESSDKYNIYTFTPLKSEP